MADAAPGASRWQPTSTLDIISEVMAIAPKHLRALDILTITPDPLLVAACDERTIHTERVKQIGEAPKPVRQCPTRTGVRHDHVRKLVH